MTRLSIAVLRTLDRVNREHPWSHNDFYTGWVLRRARLVRRAGGRRALDVGCGTGKLVARLAPIMSSVVGIEPDPRTAQIARTSVLDVPNAEIREMSFDGIADERFDLITFVAVLHHLPFEQTLRTAHALLAPGGRLIIVGVFRESPADRWWTMPSLLLNPLIGLLRHPRRARELPAHMTAPVAPPADTFVEVSAALRRELPGVVVRRSLFWRYLATWQAPNPLRAEN